MSNYSIESIEEMLDNHVCVVTFKKKRDNTLREMTCTSNWKWLNREDVCDAVGFALVKRENRAKKSWKPNQKCVYDLDEENWRSFYLDKVKSIRIIQRLDVEEFDEE